MKNSLRPRSQNTHAYLIFLWHSYSFMYPYVRQRQIKSCGRKAQRKYKFIDFRIHVKKWYLEQFFIIHSLFYLLPLLSCLNMCNFDFSATKNPAIFCNSKAHRSLTDPTNGGGQQNYYIIKMVFKA
jgi:hypothetical protein